MRYSFVCNKLSNKILQKYDCYFAVILSARNKRKRNEEFCMKFYIVGKTRITQSVPWLGYGWTTEESRFNSRQLQDISLL